MTLKIRSKKEILESIHENLLGIMESDFITVKETEHIKAIDADIMEALEHEQ